ARPPPVASPAAGAPPPAWNSAPAGAQGGGPRKSPAPRPAPAHAEPKPPVVLTPQALRRAAEPGLDRELADVAGELDGVLTPAFAALPEQPLVGIGGKPRHAAERARHLDDHGMHAVIVQPQRARHARRPAADDRHDRRSWFARLRHVRPRLRGAPIVRRRRVTAFSAPSGSAAATDRASNASAVLIADDGGRAGSANFRQAPDCGRY